MRSWCDAKYQNVINGGVVDDVVVVRFLAVETWFVARAFESYRCEELLEAMILKVSHEGSIEAAYELAMFSVVFIWSFISLHSLDVYGSVMLVVLFEIGGLYIRLFEREFLRRMQRHEHALGGSISVERFCMPGVILESLLHQIST